MHTIKSALILLMHGANMKTHLMLFTNIGITYNQFYLMEYVITWKWKANTYRNESKAWKRIVDATI